MQETLTFHKFRPMQSLCQNIWRYRSLWLSLILISPLIFLDQNASREIIITQHHESSIYTFSYHYFKILLLKTQSMWIIASVEQSKRSCFNLNIQCILSVLPQTRCNVLPVISMKLGMRETKVRPLVAHWSKYVWVRALG